jgi:ankyrin repeat protein
MVGAVAIVAAIVIHEYPRPATKAPAVGEILGAAAQGKQRELEELIRQHEGDAQLEEDLEAALRMACMYEQEGIVKMLLRRGVDANSRGPRGITPLMSGALQGKLAIARRLIEAGADVNAADEQGRTALMEAVVAENDRLVGLLIEAGADVGAVDGRGRTALSEAAQSGNIVILGRIKAAVENPVAARKLALGGV